MENFITVQTNVVNPIQSVKAFVKEHIGEIDTDIEVSAIYDRWSWRRDHELKGIQFSVGGYGRKTIKRVMVTKEKQVSLIKMKVAIKELTKLAKEDPALVR